MSAAAQIEEKTTMEKQSDIKPGWDVSFIIRYSSALTILMAFVVVIPFTLWFTWGHHWVSAYSIAVTLFCLSFGWAAWSMLQTQRGLRKLNLSSSDRMRLFSGSRPDNPDELCVWKWAWQFICAVIAGLLSLIAIPVVSSFSR
jgi:hypothetical protein